MPIQTIPFDPTRFLDGDEACAIFLNDAIEEGDPAGIRQALGIVARARGMTQLARDAGMSRKGLYKALDDGGNPGFDVVAKLLRAFGLQIRVQPVRIAKKRQRSVRKPAA
jgi:probable addiction module antidote protein